MANKSKDKDIESLKEALMKAFDDVLDKSIAIVIRNYRSHAERGNPVGKSPGFMYAPRFKVEETDDSFNCVALVDDSAKYHFESDLCTARKDLPLLDKNNEPKNFD